MGTFGTNRTYTVGRVVKVEDLMRLGGWLRAGSIPSVSEMQNFITENSNLHGFEVHRPSSKDTKLPLQVIKAIINQGTGAGVKPGRQHQPQGSVTVSLLAFWHPQLTTTSVGSCEGWPAGNEQVGMRAPG